MANPQAIDLSNGIGAWTKIASSVTGMTIHRKTSSAIYFMTYRDAGDTAPTEEPAPDNDGVWIFQNGSTHGFQNSVVADVYIWVKEGGIDPCIEVNI